MIRLPFICRSPIPCLEASFSSDTSSGRPGQVFYVTATGVFRQNLTPVRNRECAMFCRVSEHGTGLGVVPWFRAFGPDLSLFGWRWVPTASRGLCNGEARRFAKPLDLLGRNAKTRWGEPAGHFASSHLAVALLVEAAGIEPASRNASDPASTCLANCYFLALRVRCRHRCEVPASSFFNHHRARHGPWRFGITAGTPAPPTGPGCLGSLI